MTIPQPITPEQMAAARKLVHAQRDLLSRVGPLRTRLSEANRIGAETSRLIYDRIKFKNDLTKFIGLAEWLQRQHPIHHKTVVSHYRWFLIEMRERYLTGPDPSMLSLKPRQVDFHALHPAARPYLLGPFLGIAPGDTFAEVDLTQAKPAAGHLVMVQTGAPIDPDLWKSKLSAISAWLGGQWTVTAHDASTITLTRHLPLPAVIPYDRSMLRQGQLFVGIDTIQRRPVHIPFADLSAGTYLPGCSGSGKTSAVHVLLRSIFPNLDLFEACWLIDGKDGVAFNRYAHIHPKVRVLYDEPDVWRLVADLNITMRERNAEQRACGVDKATSGFIAVVIDELPTFIAKPGKAQKADHDVFLENLQRLAMRGRSAGIRLFLITQQPVAEQIPVTLRTNCSTLISFRLPETAHATMLLGELTPANDPRKLPTGQAIVVQSDSGKLTTVQFPLAPLYRPSPWAIG